MIRVILLCSIVFSVVGCSRDIGRDKSSFIEYVVSSENPFGSHSPMYAVLLSDSGLARVDLMAQNDPQQRDKIYIVPASKDAIESLCMILDGLNDRSFSQVESPAFGPSSILIRWHHGGSDHVLHFSQGLRRFSFIVDGICRELELVSSLRLAEALNACYLAEAQSTPSAIIRLYGDAIAKWESWMGEIYKRNAVSVDEIIYRDVEIGKYVVTISRKAYERTMALSRENSRIDDASVVDALRFSWQHWTSEICTTPSNNAVVVSFPALPDRSMMNRIYPAIPSEKEIKMMLDWRWTRSGHFDN